MRPAMIAGVSETAFTQLSTYIDSRRDHQPEAVGVYGTRVVPKCQWDRS